MPTAPDAARVLRLSLLGWGLGHVALGDRRGWLLLALQPVAIALLIAVAADLIDTGRWLFVFALLAFILGVWGGQAVRAYRLAVARGSERRGSLQLMALGPLAIVAVTAFWLVGGGASTPSATLQRYVSAWQNGHPAAAAPLFATPRSADAVAAEWAADAAYLRARLAALALELGPTSRLDPLEPFESLRFEYRDGVMQSGDEAIIDVLIVRQVPVRRSFLGIFPATAQAIRVVERAGSITLTQVPASRLLPGDPEARAWRIASARLGEGG